MHVSYGDKNEFYPIQRVSLYPSSATKKTLYLIPDNKNLTGIGVCCTKRHPVKQFLLVPRYSFETTVTHISRQRSLSLKN